MSGQRIILMVVLIVIAIFLIMYYINWSHAKDRSVREVLQSMRSDLNF